MHAVEAFGRHANDCEGMPVHGYGPTHHVWVGIELLLPIVVVENNHWVLAQHLAFAGQKQAARRRPQPQAAEEIAAHIGGEDALRLLALGGDSIQAKAMYHHVAERTAGLGANLLVLRP